MLWLGREGYWGLFGHLFAYNLILLSGAYLCGFFRFKGMAERSERDRFSLASESRSILLCEPFQYNVVFSTMILHALEHSTVQWRTAKGTWLQRHMVAMFFYADLRSLLILKIANGWVFFGFRIFRMPNSMFENGILFDIRNYSKIFEKGKFCSKPTAVFHKPCLLFYQFS